MQKDRFIFALVIYGVVLLAGAGICSYLFPGNISAVANSGTVSESTELPGTDDITPTKTITPTELPKPTASASKDDENEDKNSDDYGEDGENRKNEQKTVWELLSVDTTPEWREIIGERCVVLPKPETMEAGQPIRFSLTDMPVERSIALRLQGCVETDYGYDAVERVANGLYYNTEPTAETDPLCGMKQVCTLQSDGSYEIYIELLLNKTYVYNVYETETHYFIALIDAKDVYDRIVVLDAGHGGWDTGTPSYDGKFLEKTINLQVLQYLETLLQEEDIKVYSTRTTDRNIGHSERIELANSLDADMFISIHCNNAYQNSEANGTEVLYNQYHNSKDGLSSKILSQLCLEEVVAVLQLNNRGLFARGDDLTVLQKAKVPATLVELAFMSNAGDMEVLKTDEAQKAAAEALYRAIMRAYKVMSED